MPKPPKKPKLSTGKATKPELKPLDTYLADLLNPAINRERERFPSPAAGFAEQPQATYAHGEVTDVDPALAKKLGLKGPEDGPDVGARLGRISPPDGVSGVSATVDVADAAAHRRQPAVQGRQAVDAAPAAPAREVGRRHPLQDQVGVRARRRPAEGDRRARRRRAPAGARPGAARRHRLGQDLHHGQGDRGDAAPGADPRAQQDAGGAALRRVQDASSPTTRSSTSSPTTTTTSPRPTSRARTPTSRRNCSINEQIDRMRHSATRALLERDDVIIVASVSCIYGIGSVETYTAMTFSVTVGEKHRAAPAHRRSRGAAIQAHPDAISPAAPSACAAT